MNQGKKWITFFAGAVLLMIIMACSLLLPGQSQEPQAPLFPTENAYIEVERVPLEDAKAAFDQGTAIFVDVRSSSAYADAHIPGALSIPGTELDAHLDELDPDQWIITYCT